MKRGGIDMKARNLARARGDLPSRRQETEGAPASGRVGANAPGTRQAEESPEADRSFRCRSCGARVARGRDVFGPGGASPVQVFPNPSGQMRRILTVRFASGMTFLGEPTTDFTWFKGYSWTIALCAACGAHLGWRYDRVALEEAWPERFFGLLVDALVEG